MTRIEELKHGNEEEYKQRKNQFITELRNQLNQVCEMSKEEFSTFFHKNYMYYGTEYGLYLTIDELFEKGFDIVITTESIYDMLPQSYHDEIAENFSKEDIEQYEHDIWKAGCDLINSRVDSLMLTEVGHQINDIVEGYFLRNQDDVEEEILYNARDYIVEETIDQLNQLIEDEED